MKPDDPVHALADLVRFEAPGKSRVLTKEEIAAEYGERASRPIPEGYRPRKKRKLNERMAADARFYVCRVHEGGQRKFISGHASWEWADKEAGRLRDAMTDEDCAKDFTYQAFERKRGFGTQKRGAK